MSRNNLTFPISTINVVECTKTDSIDGMHITSFPKTDEDRRTAEILFLKIIKEGASDTGPVAMAQYLNDQYCAIGEGYVALVDSSLS